MPSFLWASQILNLFFSNPSHIMFLLATPVHTMPKVHSIKESKIKEYFNQQVQSPAMSSVAEIHADQLLMSAINS